MQKTHFLVEKLAGRRQSNGQSADTYLSTVLHGVISLSLHSTGDLEHSKARAVPWRRDEKDGTCQQWARKEILDRRLERSQTSRAAEEKAAQMHGSPYIHDAPQQWGGSAVKPLETRSSSKQPSP